MVLAITTCAYSHEFAEFYVEIDRKFCNMRCCRGMLKMNKDFAYVTCRVYCTVLSG